MAQTTRAVAIGGGHGLSRSLRALRDLADETVAIVTVADDGGSSGRLRRDLDIIPPGDLRMALAALSGDPAMAELAQYRFPEGELAGHSLGNLMLVALRDLAGEDMLAALRRAGRMLSVRGAVLPCTETPLVLHASSAAGAVRGQAAVARTPQLTRVWIEPEHPPAAPGVVAAVGDADLIVLGPGSLYTSLIPNLLVNDIAAAVAASPAPVVLVGNLREQVGETQGMELQDHLAALSEHAPEISVDVLVAHDGPAPGGPGRPLKADRGGVVGAGRVVTADLLDGGDGHDPEALAAVLEGLLQA